jgi:hypothetical protein
VAPAQALSGVQLRFKTTAATGEEYVTRRLWQEASLPRCPEHRAGGCGLKRHTAYERKHPAGAKVARWYCPTARKTFSLLPDCLASRFPAELSEIEAVVAVAERAPSVASAVASLWPELGLVGAQRKLRRWAAAVAMMLTLSRGLMPEVAPAESTVAAFRERMSTQAVLMELREELAERLQALPAPVGFGPRMKARPSRRRREQHETVPDPPK